MAEPTLQDDEVDPLAPPDATTSTDRPTAAPPDAPKQSRRRRKWERTHPHDWRYFVGMAGRVLIATGLLLFGFVAYQLWGTGIETARAQRKLENEFETMLAAAPTTTEAPAPATTTADTPATTEPPTSTPSAGTSPATTPPATQPPAVDQVMPAFTSGDAIARLEIPEIGVDDIVVAGVSVDDLRKGPGHFPDTPLPGQLGNSAIAGHRTTYGQPFRDVDDLAPGDEIVVTTLAGRFVYTVTGTQIVNPGDYWVVATTDPTVATLTLTSCHPVWEASQRIVVSAELDATRSAPVGNPTFYDAETVEELPGDESADSTPTATDPDATAGSTPVGADGPTTSAPATGAEAGSDDEPTTPELSGATEDAFAHGWFDDDGAFLQVAAWGIVLILVSVGSYLLSKRFKRDLVGFAVGVIPFVVALYFFFQNVNRLLPPSL